MEKGKHPNSLAALAGSREATQFRGESAVENQKKSVEVQREKGRIRRAVEGKLDADPSLKDGIADAIIKGCIAGNVGMLKLYMEMTGEKESEKLELLGSQDLQISLKVVD